jgi:spoIIIJ-associated protein
VSNRKTEATATHVEEALASTLAEVLTCDPRDVQVRVEAPRLDEYAGRWQVSLTFEDDAAAAPPPRDAHADEVEAPPAAEDDVASDLGAPEVLGAPLNTVATFGDGEPGDDDEPGDREERSTDEEDRLATEVEQDDEGVVESQEEAVSAEDVEDDALDALEEEAEAAADFIEGLLDALDLPGDLRIRYAEDHAEVEVVDVGSGALIGRRGQTLEAIQELMRCSLQREFQRRARVKVDVEGYRSRRLEKLIEKADEAIDAVLDTGEPERLEPMDVFERKAVHHRVAEVGGLISRSQGREPARRIIIERD